MFFYVLCSTISKIEHKNPLSQFSMGKWVNFVNVISSEIIDGLLFLRLCSFLAIESKVLKCIDHEFHKFWQITRIFDDKTGDFMLNSKAMFWIWLVRFSMFFHVRSDLLEKTPCMFYTAFWTELTSSAFVFQKFVFFISFQKFDPDRCL